MGPTGLHRTDQAWRPGPYQDRQEPPGAGPDRDRIRTEPEPLQDSEDHRDRAGLSEYRARTGQGRSLEDRTGPSGSVVERGGVACRTKA